MIENDVISGVYSLNDWSITTTWSVKLFEEQSSIIWCLTSKWVYCKFG